jgi:hypothetical protein
MAARMAHFSFHLTIIKIILSIVIHREVFKRDGVKKTTMIELLREEDQMSEKARRTSLKSFITKL